LADLLRFEFKIREDVKMIVHIVTAYFDYSKLTQIVRVYKTRELAENKAKILEELCWKEINVFSTQVQEQE